MKRSTLVSVALGLAMNVASLAMAGTADHNQLRGEPNHYRDHQTWHIYEKHHIRQPSPVNAVIKSFPVHLHAAGEPNQYYDHGVWHINGQHINRNSQQTVVQVVPADAVSIPH